MASALTKRILSASVLAPIVIAAAYYGDAYFTLLITLVGIMMWFEWYRMTRTQSFLWKITGLFYALIPSASLIAIRSWTSADNASIGLDMLFWLVAVVWTTDIAAYAFGRTIGGPKLAPKISPGKTWSGLIGGVVSATVIATLLCHTLLVDLFHQHLISCAFWSAIMAIAAQLGDLFESWVKRRCNVKDSGTLIPGHGGILDRVDGFTTTAPLTFLIAYSGIIL